MKLRSGSLSLLKEECGGPRRESGDNGQAEAAAGKVSESAAGISSSHTATEEKSATSLHGSLWARGKERVTAEMQKAMAMTDRLKGELEQMIEEHEAAVEKLRRLSERYARLARKLR